MIGTDAGTSERLRAACAQFSQTQSRRSFVAGVLRITLGLVGVSTAYQLVGPASQANADSNCSQCSLCGLCGKPCDACGGTLGACPSGTAQGTSYWSFCCGCGACATYRYYDCCGTSSCSATKCETHCDQMAWCGGSGYSVYNCTIAIQGLSCNPC